MPNSRLCSRAKSLPPPLLEDEKGAICANWNETVESRRLVTHSTLKQMEKFKIQNAGKISKGTYDPIN